MVKVIDQNLKAKILSAGCLSFSINLEYRRLLSDYASTRPNIDFMSCAHFITSGIKNP